MISAIGWRIIVCEMNHLHIELFGKDDQVFAELSFENHDDLQQFCEDLAEMIEKARKGYN